MKNSLLFLLNICIFSSFSCAHRVQPVVTADVVQLSHLDQVVLDNKVSSFVQSGELSGVSVGVFKDGAEVYSQSFGYADRDNAVRVDSNTVFRVFSMTKPVTAVALMTLYDQGKFRLDDPVSKYIPYFSKLKVYDNRKDCLVPTKSAMTIRHLLTHSSGLSYGWTDSYVDSLYQQSNLMSQGSMSCCVKKLASLPLNFHPGSRFCYGYSIDVAGYLVEVLSGMSLAQYLTEKIFQPLEMSHTAFHLSSTDREKLSRIYTKDKHGCLIDCSSRFDWLYSPDQSLLSGGGGLVSTLHDYMNFCIMLLHEGTYKDKQILTPSAVHLIMSQQLPSTIPYQVGLSYGLGAEVDLSTGEYHWSGMGSTEFWIDRKNELIIITLAQLVPGNHHYANEIRKTIRSLIIKE